MKVHKALLPKDGGYAYAACAGWLNVPYTLLDSAVTCLKCLKKRKSTRSTARGQKGE